MRLTLQPTELHRCLQHLRGIGFFIHSSTSGSSKVGNKQNCLQYLLFMTKLQYLEMLSSGVGHNDYDNLTSNILHHYIMQFPEQDPRNYPTFNKMFMALMIKKDEEIVLISTAANETIAKAIEAAELSKNSRTMELEKRYQRILGELELAGGLGREEGPGGPSGVGISRGDVAMFEKLVKDKNGISQQLAGLAAKYDELLSRYNIQVRELEDARIRINQLNTRNNEISAAKSRCEAKIESYEAKNKKIMKKLQELRLMNSERSRQQKYVRQLIAGFFFDFSNSLTETTRQICHNYQVQILEFSSRCRSSVKELGQARNNATIQINRLRADLQEVILDLALLKFEKKQNQSIEEWLALYRNYKNGRGNGFRADVYPPPARSPNDDFIDIHRRKLSKYWN